MSALRRNPAITAGLLGTALWMTPTQASALSFEGLISNSVAPYVQFALGCVAGAAISTAAHIAVDAISSSANAQAAPAKKSAHAKQEVVAKKKADAKQDQKVEKKAEEKVEQKADKPSEVVVVAKQEEAQPVQQPAPAPAKAGRAATAPKARHAGAHFRKEAAPAKARGKHMAVKNSSFLPVAPKETKAVAPVEPLEVLTKDAMAVEDYSDVAENYVRRNTLRERMATRAAGVANVLAERINGDPLDGLPVITRADGTVGDVGTAWWNDTVGSSIRRIEDIPQDGEPVQYMTPQMSRAAAERFERNAHASRRAAYISQNVAEVNVGIYPERRTVAELDNDDVWDLALQAMGERLGQHSAPVFMDAIGTIETIDEPYGLEDPTGFIPFRRPAGHPEIVDTNSYVDYLIDDEFSRNPSRAARKSSRDFLTVIQGGSQKMRATSSRRDQGHRPKHFASPSTPLAREA